MRTHLTKWLTIWLSLGHSRSLKLVPFKSLGAVSYQTSTVTMAVSVAVCEIFSVKEWRDLENRVRVRSRSIFIPHLYLAPPQGVTPSEFPEDI